jgi:hypothetical protein
MRDTELRVTVDGDAMVTVGPTVTIRRFVMVTVDPNCHPRVTRGRGRVGG